MVVGNWDFDWEHMDMPEPEEMTFDWEVEWLGSVVKGYCEQARKSALAAQIVVEHVDHAAESAEERTRALYHRMVDAAQAATRAHTAACAQLAALKDAKAHNECAQLIGELAVRSMDAGLHLTTVVGLFKLLVGDPDPDLE